MEIQHFNSFKLSLQEADLEKIVSLEDDLPNALDGEKKKFMAEGTNELIEKYGEFTQEARNGNHGKTAKYWMGYVDIFHLYREFWRSMRIGDQNLYIYFIQQINVFFFTFNHQNYSRWLTLNNGDLLTFKKSYPGIYEEFNNDYLWLKRTSKPCSRIPIDLTLEQTINSDAACQRRSIISLTNTKSARQRWAQSNSSSTSNLPKLFEELRMTSKQDISEELKPHRMKQNCHDLKKIISSIHDTMNRFASTIKK